MPSARNRRERVPVPEPLAQLALVEAEVVGCGVESREVADVSEVAEASGTALFEPPEEGHLAGVDPRPVSAPCSSVSRPSSTAASTRAFRALEGVLELARLDAETVGGVVEDGATLVVRRERARGGDRSGRAEGDGDEGSGHEGRDDLRSGDPAHERHQTTLV